MRALMIVLLMALLPGCGEPWDPGGTYELAQLWGTGDCNLRTPRVVQFFISERQDGSFLVETDLEDDVEGRLLRVDGANCIMDLQVEEPPGSGLGFAGRTVLNYNIVENADDVEGTGLITVGQPDNCTQSFTVEGNRL